MGVYMVKYRVSGSRTKTVVLQAESADAARRSVSDMVTSDQMDNNLFFNLDFVKVEPYQQEKKS